MSAACLKTACSSAPEYGCAGYCHRHYRQRLRMGLTGFVDAAPVIAHIEKLRALGWTFVQIGDASGIAFTQPCALLPRRYRRVRRKTADALLSVPLEPAQSRRGVDSTGTQRRIQALAWMGWTLEAVAQRAGMDKKLAATAYRSRVSYSVAHRIARAYDELSHLQGPSKGAASKAHAAGHAPPVAWDGVNMDDPRTEPVGVAGRAA